MRVKEINQSWSIFTQRLRGEGLVEGFQNGLERGKAEGKAEGVRASIVLILQHKYGTVPGQVIARLKTIQETGILENLVKQIFFLSEEELEHFAEKEAAQAKKRKDGKPPEDDPKRPGRGGRKKPGKVDRARASTQNANATIQEKPRSKAQSCKVPKKKARKPLATRRGVAISISRSAREEMQKALPKGKKIVGKLRRIRIQKNGKRFTLEHAPLTSASAQVGKNSPGNVLLQLKNRKTKIGKRDALRWVAAVQAAKKELGWKKVSAFYISTSEFTRGALQELANHKIRAIHISR